MNYAGLIAAAQDEATRQFFLGNSPRLPYHNLSHTARVAGYAETMGKHYQLSEKDQAVLLVSAWFHDIGYLSNTATDHEKRGAETAALFLKNQQAGSDFIDDVAAGIIATTIPQHPQSLIEKILCDADLYHFGTDEFPDLNKLLRKEVGILSGTKISKEVWRADTIRFLSAHQYHTDYATDRLEERKQQQIDALKAKDREDEKDRTIVLPGAENEESEEEGDDESHKKSSGKDGPGRGVETMFRISSGNHQRLSDMADNKANIMITITSIIFSVLLSILLQKLEENTHLVIPSLLLLAVCVITMVFSILATRPSLPSGIFTKKDVDEKKVNLLFFGNFYRMNYSDYQDGMGKMMNDRSFLYGSLTRDVYSQGVVLGRKYRLLRLSYNVFMYGIILSVIAFAVSITTMI